MPSQTFGSPFLENKNSGLLLTWVIFLFFSWRTQARLHLFLFRKKEFLSLFTVVGEFGTPRLSFLSIPAALFFAVSLLVERIPLRDTPLFLQW